MTHPNRSHDSQATRCPFCQSDDWTDLGTCCPLAELASDKTPAVIREIAEQTRNSRLAECNHCFLRFRTPQLTHADLKRLYQNLPETIWQYEPTAVGSWVAAKKQLVTRTNQHSAIKVLDVGAFDGAFLKQLPQCWKKFAIEPSPTGQHELQKAGIKLIANFVEDLTVDAETNAFDIVTLFDVFEHLPDPKQTLQTLASLVKPSGQLVISTTNADHWSWRLMKGQHWYLHSVQHLAFASPRFFRAWGETDGMPVESITRHAHQIEKFSTRLRHSLELCHAWSKMNERSYLTRLIQSLPGMRHLAHKQGVVFANSLSDHQLTIFRRPAKPTK